MKRILLAILALGLTPVVAPAQQAPATAPQAAAPETNPVSNGFRRFRANYGLCGLITGAKPPAPPAISDDSPKDTLVPALKASFQFCTDSLAPIDDSHFGEQVPFFGGKLVSRGFMLVTMSEDLGDHYSTAAMYLRLNGLLPPTAQPKK